jgi:polyhydroxyalkanoate synthase
MQLLNPKKPRNNRFVLGASGHIAGVINPASKGKRSHWVNNANGKARPKSSGEWMAGSTETKGSWWPEWAKFLAEFGGKEVAAPAAPGNGQYRATEPAPGRYVKVRAD